MKRLLGFAGFVDRCNRRLAGVAFWLMLVVVAVCALSTLLHKTDQRFGTSLSNNGLIELQWYLFGVIFLLGASHTLRKGGHVRVDVIYDRLPARARHWVNLIGHGVFLVPFCAAMIILSSGPVWSSLRVLEASPDAGGLPRYPIKLLIPLAFAFLLLQGLAEMIRHWAAIVGVATEDPVRDGGPQ